MKKSPPAAPASALPSPAFGVDGDAGTGLTRRESAATATVPAAGFNRETGRHGERSRRFRAIRHYVIDDEPDDDAS